MSPQFLKKYKQSESKFPIVPEVEDNEEYGRFIGVKISVETNKFINWTFRRKKNHK